MGHVFNEFIVSTIRQAIPVISAVMGAFYGASRAGRTGGRQLTNVAAFAGLGWLGGYVLRSTLIHLIEGGSRALPTATVQQFPPPPTAPEPPSTTVAAPPMQGMPEGIDPYSYSAPQQAQSVSTVDQSGVTTGAPPPRADNEGVSYGPPRPTRGPNGRQNRTLVTSAYGNPYGN